MTNEEKASEIANKYRGREVDRMAALEMAEWKDEQYAKVVTKLIVELDELKHQVKSLLP